MKTKPKINTRLFRRIQTLIREEPRRMDMDVPIQENDHEAPCGTAACIAGFAVVADTMKRFDLDFGRAGKKAERIRINVQTKHRSRDDDPFNSWSWVRQRAIKLLGLTPSQADVLFHVSEWPWRFKEAYEDAPDRRRAARVAISAIDNFLKTKGWKDVA